MANENRISHKVVDPSSIAGRSINHGGMREPSTQSSGNSTANQGGNTGGNTGTNQGQNQGQDKK